MSLLARMRRSRGTCGRALVALFAISWMGLAVQPCAAGAGHDHAGAAGHEMPAGHGDPGCPHCPPAPAADDECGAGSALNCDGVDVPAPPAKAADAPQWDDCAAIDLPSVASISLRSKGVEAPKAVFAVWRPPSASVQQRFCTFLK